LIRSFFHRCLCNLSLAALFIALSWQPSWKFKSSAKTFTQRKCGQNWTYGNYV